MRSERNPYRQEKTKPERPPSCRPQQSTFLKRDKKAGSSSKLSLQEHRNVSNVAPGMVSLAGRAGLLLALTLPPRCVMRPRRPASPPVPDSPAFLRLGSLCEQPPSRPAARTLGLATVFPPAVVLQWQMSSVRLSRLLRPSVPLAPAWFRSPQVCAPAAPRLPRRPPSYVNLIYLFKHNVANVPMVQA